MDRLIRNVMIECLQNVQLLMEELGSEFAMGYKQRISSTTMPKVYGGSASVPRPWYSPNATAARRLSINKCSKSIMIFNDFPLSSIEYRSFE